MITPPTETIRISQQGKDQMLKIRRQTGIEHWNVICRWALCASLRELAPPTTYHEKMDGGVEMSWKVFAGDLSDTFVCLIKMRTEIDGFAPTQEGIAACLRAHLHRGIGYLASGTQTRSIADFTKRWMVSVA